MGYNPVSTLISALAVRRPSRESHSSGLTWQGGWCMYVPWFGGKGGSCSPFSAGGPVPQTLWLRKPHDGGGTSHSQCLCTASCLQVCSDVSVACWIRRRRTYVARRTCRAGGRAETPSSSTISGNSRNSPDSRWWVGPVVAG